MGWSKLLLAWALLAGAAPVAYSGSFRGILVEKFVVDSKASQISPELPVALELEVLKRLNGIKGCEMAVRESRSVQLPRPALRISGTILGFRPTSRTMRDSPSLVVHIRFTDLETGKLLHEADVSGTRAVFGAIGSLDFASRGFAQSLAKLTRQRFFD